MVEPGDDDLVPGPQCCAIARATSKVSAVALRPKTTPPGSVASRSPSAARHPTTTSSARRAAAVTVPRFEIDEPSVDATACATCRGTWLPPGPSKWAVPEARAGKSARTRSTS